MSAAYISLSCTSYKQNLFSGLAFLQQAQEFVDLTLAADGHLVKVHKNVMALASPYIKEILKTSSGDNFVIFLNNVSHTQLRYLLEYIYQGEVNVPQESLESFMQLAQSLSITGITKPNEPEVLVSKQPETYMTQRNVNQISSNSQVERGNSVPDKSASELKKEKLMTKLMANNALNVNNSSSNTNVAACITINNDRNVEVQNYVENIPIVISNLDDNQLPIVTGIESFQNDVPINNTLGIYVCNTAKSMEVDDISAQVHLPISEESASKLSVISIDLEPKSNSNANTKETPLLDLNSLGKESVDALKSNIMQYSVTERGAVQIIVNRYIYLNHHESNRGRKRRWRCIDYRRLRCPAFIDSLDESLILRKGSHTHGYHDDRIYKKHQKGIIYSSYKLVCEAKMDKNSSSINKFDYSEGDD